MNPFGLFVALFGVVGVIWPYRVARFEEQMDSIGSKRRFGEVEPTDWRVTLTRVVGGVFVVLGLAMLFG